MNELPDLVSAADYLEIDTMLKDSLFQSCQNIPSAHELQSIFSMKIPSRKYILRIFRKGKVTVI
jgi:hypothetical protein